MNGGLRLDVWAICLRGSVMCDQRGGGRRGRGGEGRRGRQAGSLGASAEQ